jgi:hypothetical protein
MSQILVTGEAKIRDIQGPVVANSGVITALDGAANQYVRGDGTLAIFPTSSGGGSSVSYYLNGSVNQGTFGGSTYYQMSRNAIVGTGTNFSTSSDGLIAQFITDANDPDVVSIPSGNWNVEFFMNVSASSGALASFYVEIYKYNGSTFTLLATNVATPEQLTNTTTVDAYFTSVAMPLSAMAVTDRLAVRVFANVASKTVTLYTEDNRLCQIVTTFSNGLTSLNNLTDQSQYLTTGTSGTDFNIVSSGDTHTFNIPSASATNRGLVTIGSQSFEGIKTFNDAIKGEEGVLLKNGVISSSNGYTALNAFENTLIITSLISGTPYSNSLEFTPSTSNTYTFPNATGTIALTSDLSSYVPYTGATASVNLGTYGLKAGSITTEGGYNFKILASGTLFENGYSVLSSVAGNVSITQAISAGNLKTFTFDFSAWATNTSRTYTLPDITGTLALLEGTQTFSGSKTFSTGIKAESGIFLKELSSSGRLTGYVGISATATGGMQQIQFLYPVSGSSVFSLPTTGAYNYEFPIVSGTIALTSDLSGYVTLATNQTITGAKIFTSAITNNQGYILKDLGAGGYLSVTAGFGGFSYNNTVAGFARYNFSESNGSISILNFPTSVSSKLYTFPDASGTIALTSDLGSYVTIGTTQTITGAKTFTQNLALDGNASNAGTLLLKSNSALPTAIGYTGINSTNNSIYLTTFVSNPKTAALDLSGLSDNIIRTFTFPNASGTLALTSNLSAYLPLTGGTLTGALSGTSATFSGTVEAPLFFANAGGSLFLQSASDAISIRQNSTSNNLTIRFNRSGVDLWKIQTVPNGANEDFKIFNSQNSTNALTIASTGAATFSSSVTANFYDGEIFRVITSSTFRGGIGTGSWAFGDGTTDMALYSQAAVKIGAGGTQKMVITSSGNVGIGTSSPAAPLQVVATGVGGYGTIGIKGSNAHLGYRTAADEFKGWVGYFNSGTHGSDTDLNIKTGYNGSSNIRFGINGDSGEAMRITSGGNVLIGTATDGGNILDVLASKDVRFKGATNYMTLNLDNSSTTGGGGIYFRQNGTIGGGIGNSGWWLGDTSNDLLLVSTSGKNIRFHTNDSSPEKMRITSGGDVLIGTTTASANLFVNNGGAGNTFGARNTNASFAATIGFFGADRNTTNNSFYYIDCYNFGSGTYRFRVADSGNVTSSGSVTATSFFESSDSRLKILVKDYEQPKGIENVAARMYVKNNKQELGYYAQDLQEILPSAVSEGDDGFLNLSYSQVHTAKIAYLEDKVAQLEELIKSLKIN